MKMEAAITAPTAGTVARHSGAPPGPVNTSPWGPGVEASLRSAWRMRNDTGTRRCSAGSSGRRTRPGQCARTMI